MYVASLPFFPTDKRTYEIEKIRPEEQIMMQLYPEIYSCIGCNACTKACTQNLNVMQYIAYAREASLRSARRSLLTAWAAASVPPGARRVSPIPWWACWQEG